MASIVPAGVYGLRIPAGGQPIPASSNPNVAFRITMAAIDPTAEVDGETARATLKLIRIQDDDEDDEDDDDYDPDNIEELRARLLADGVLGPDDESDDSEEDDSENETNGGPSDPAKSKQAMREALQKKLQEEAAAEEMDIDLVTNGVNGTKGKGKALDDDLSDDDSEEDDEEADEAEELVLCTLDPEKHYQQALEITVREGEEVYFSATGSHDIYLTGNYVAILDDDEDDDDEADLYGLGEDDYDESPDEDELDEELSESEDDELDGLNDPRFTEVDSEEEEVPKLVKADKKGKKRPADSDDEAMTLDELITKTKADAPATNGEEKLSKKQAKKLKNNEGQAVVATQESKKEQKKEKVDTPSSDKKKVQFAKNLEQGPTGSSPKVTEAKKEPAKGPRNVGGVTVEDKKEGKGKAAKKGDRIEMRYIGKLKNGKQFDANKKGKPFSFKLGVGEVIKGWDVGVAGMQAGSERRLTIPAKLAYGSKALPGIPANSELIFDIKCISVS